MGHNHAAAAVALQAKLVHGVAIARRALESVSQCLDHRFQGFLPIGDVLVDQHQVALPEIAGHLQCCCQWCLLAPMEKSLPTLPQEKHRTGIIIVNVWLF